MSNLLSSLIARTTETAESAAVILQPRPRALFETETPAAMPALPTENLETAVSTLASHQAPASAEPRRRQPDVNTQLEPKPAAKKQPPIERTPASQPPVPPQITVVSTSPPEKTAVSATKPAPDQPHIQPIVVETRLVREQPDLQPQLQRIVPLETAVSSTFNPSVPDIKPGRKEQSDPAQPARLDAPSVPPLPKIELPAAKSAPHTIQTTINTSLAGPKAVPRRPEAIVPTQAVPHLPPEQKRPLPDATPEPVIQVHIGRIEVRATPAETGSSAKKQRHLPVMGLDDYLHQRSARTERGKP